MYRLIPRQIEKKEHNMTYTTKLTDILVTDMAFDRKNSHFSLPCEDLFDSWLKI